uniref:UBA/THIF-type NAD/FAD binding protein n=1 Tax=mine drainage metagenome TaxID=410659 RepID=E6QVS7_9ZZZZ
MNHKFLLDKTYRRTLNIALVGAGGTGSQVLTGLARMAVALHSLQLEDLHVTVYDPDTVSTANVGRQLFSSSDVGLPKATVLVNRINAYFGFSWNAVQSVFPSNAKTSMLTNILVSCVDTRIARKEIYASVQNQSCYWLDLGNSNHSGQAVLGNSDYASRRPSERRKYTLLPTVADLFPEILDDQLPEDDAPSCSLAEALHKQDLMVNQVVATHAMELLWQLLRHGEIQNHGFFFNTKAFSMQPIPVDKQVWDRYLKQAKKVRQRTASQDTPTKNTSLVAA